MTMRRADSHLTHRARAPTVRGKDTHLGGGVTTAMDKRMTADALHAGRYVSRTGRRIVGVMAVALFALATFHIFRNVSATAVAGGPTWQCGSVARPSLPASYGIAPGMAEDDRQVFLLDQLAWSAARDRQLGSFLTTMLPALTFAAVFGAAGKRRPPSDDEQEHSRMAST